MCQAALKSVENEVSFSVQLLFSKDGAVGTSMYFNEAGRVAEGLRAI